MIQSTRSLIHGPQPLWRPHVATPWHAEFVRSLGCRNHYSAVAALQAALLNVQKVKKFFSARQHATLQEWVILLRQLGKHAN